MSTKPLSFSIPMRAGVGRQHDVLDHGSTILLDHMAGDHKLYGSARVSTGHRPEDASKGEKEDRGLTRFLLRNGHGTPSEHAVFQWFVKAPIFVVREWQRHRMASYNEFSLRYAEITDELAEFYVPDHIRAPDPTNKQGAVRVEGIDYTTTTRRAIDLAASESIAAYRRLIAGGVAREMARVVLPLSLYTKFWFTINARSLMNFLALRNHPNAQWEIQQYAEALEEDFALVMPWTYEAFVENGRVAP